MLDREEILWLKSSCNELNNLLQRIYGAAFLSVEPTSYLPHVQENLGNIVDTVDHASHVIHSILDFAVAWERHLLGDALPAPPVVSSPKVHAPPPPPQPAPQPGPKPPAQPETPAVALPAGQPTPAPSPLGLAPMAPSIGHVGRAREPAPADFTGIDVTNPAGERELILVVDDELHVLRLIQLILSEAGYKVIVANDGFAAVNIYKRVGAAIDLVILDFAMPVMDGGEVFEELKIFDPDVPVVLSSGFPQQAKLRHMLARGLRGFMPKPYTQQKLLAQIRSALDAGKTAQ
jgi:CheY-like chemotaxis protein